MMTVEGSIDTNQDETDFGIEYDDAFSSKYVAKHILGRWEKEKLLFF